MWHCHISFGAGNIMLANVNVCLRSRLHFPTFVISERLGTAHWSMKIPTKDRRFPIPILVFISYHFLFFTLQKK